MKVKNLGKSIEDSKELANARKDLLDAKTAYYTCGRKEEDLAKLEACIEIVEKLEKEKFGE